MQLIGMLDSPYVRRVAVSALLGGVAFQHRPISILRHIDIFVKLSPLLKAPSLIADDGTVLVESSVILDYLATLSPGIAALKPKVAHEFRATGVALTVMEKAVQFHYERMLRTPEQRSESWIARVTKQLNEGLAALDREAPEAGWVGGGAVGIADVTVACAFGFAHDMVGDAFDVTPHDKLRAFAGRAEALPAFKAAPAIDGVTALGAEI
jgi:glutathione S-transferase